MTARTLRLVGCRVSCLVLLLAGVVSVAVAIAATPVGSEWMTHVSGWVDSLTSWVRGLIS